MPTIDDFEEYDGSTTLLTDRYTGDTGQFDAVAGSTTNSGAAASGSQVLHAPNDGVWNNIRSVNNGLNAYPSPGDTFTINVQQDSTDRARLVFAWAVQSDTWVADCYAVRLNNTDDFSIEKGTSGGGFTVLDSAITTLADDVWHTIEISWGTDGAMTATQYDETDAQLAQVSASDTDYGAGGIAFEANYGDGWYDAAEITPTTLSGTVTRDGTAVENATVYIIDDTNQTVEGTTTTDANGDYSFDTAGNTYHVVAEENGDTGDSNPYLSS